MAPAYEALTVDQPGQEPLADQPHWKRLAARVFASWWATAAIFCSLLAATLLLLWLLMPRPDSGAEKVGAGILFVSGKQMLLLLRNSRHNDRTWGLPGGNAEPHDASLRATATREATEELGGLPEYNVLAEILTTRGKRQQKAYTVFVAQLKGPAEAYQPQLNEEHHSYQWVDASAAAQLPLHPVVAALLRGGPRNQLAAALADPAEAAAAYAAGKPKKMGAGLLLLAGREVLLLTRNSSHNNATLSVPGGNVDLDDQHLLETATREAREEMGGCPPYELKGEVDTKRGKHGQKVFKVFLGRVSAEARAGFTPVLSAESLAWGWYPLAQLPGRDDLHPMVGVLVREHMHEIDKAFGIAPAPQG